VGYTEKVVIIGAGISGLACAFRLKQSGVLPLVLEASSRPGGVIATVHKDGFLFELGPQCPRFPPSVWSLLQDLNMESEFLPGDPKAKRYIYRSGRLHRAPFSPLGLLGTTLLSASSKFRLLSEGFRTSQPPATEESLALFVQRKFGPEVLDNLVDPLISTVFFGDSFKMGMQSAFPALVEWEKNHGSLIRGGLRALQAKRKNRKPASASAPVDGKPNPASLKVTDALPSLGTLRDGMATLPQKLAEELKNEIRYNAAVKFVTPARNTSGSARAPWQIGLPNRDTIAAEHVVFALPAYAAAQLLANSVPQLATHLSAIEYAPLAVVSFAYPRASVRHNLDGFGFMVPRREKLETICTFWNSSLFPGRAPQGQVVLTSFAGRNSTEVPHPISDEQYASAVESENARILGVKGPAIQRSLWNNSRALPQYNVGHARLVADIESLSRALPNFHLLGNFLHGRSIGDCVDSAFRVAHELHSHIRS
jgi:protoporphyrinogen/coproporphyrinogen III oxidase